MSGGAGAFHEIRLEDTSLTEDHASMLGSGGFGTVYKAKLSDRFGGRDVAIKVLDRRGIPQRGLAPNEQKKLLKEAKAMYKAKDLHVVHFYGIIMAPDKQLYALVMEFMKYGSLDQLIEGIYVPWPIRCQMMHDVADGLLELHEKGITHLDIKIRNILVDRNLKAKICDFGLSKMQQLTSGGTVILSEEKGFCGTVTHIAFELLNSKTCMNEANESSDVYSFGITLFEISSDDKLPWSDNCLKNPQQIQHIADQKGTDFCTIHVDSLAKLKNDCPPRLIDLMKKCTINDPPRRPNFADIAGCLKQMCDDQWNDRQMEEAKITIFNELMNQHVSGGDSIDGISKRPIQETKSSSMQVENQPFASDSADGISKRPLQETRTKPSQDSESKSRKQLSSKLNQLVRELERVKISRSVRESQINSEKLTALQDSVNLIRTLHENSPHVQIEQMIEANLPDIERAVSQFDKPDGPYTQPTTNQATPPGVSDHSMIGELLKTIKTLADALSVLASRSDPHVPQHTKLQTQYTYSTPPKPQFSLLGTKIHQNYHSMVSDIEPTYYLSHLIQAGYISMDESDDVKSYRTRRQRAERFLDVVLRKDDGCIQPLQAAFISNGQDHLADMLN